MRMRAISLVKEFENNFPKPREIAPGASNFYVRGKKKRRAILPAGHFSGY